MYIVVNCTSTRWVKADNLTIHSTAASNPLFLFTFFFFILKKMFIADNMQSVATKKQRK